MGCSSSTAFDDHKHESPSEKLQLSYFPQLPSAVERHTIHHVYDGDTLTVENRVSVRLSGIDAPEIKGDEAYAKESRDYCRQLCPSGGTVLLGFSGKHERQDGYGRLLAYVYVPHPSKNVYICINIALLEVGLAHLYKVKRLEDGNKKAMCEAQNKARREKRNIWKKLNVNKTVLITRNGEAFHRVGGSCVNKAQKVTVKEALDQLYAPCRTCKPLG
ncbi:Staphylococcal nuclease (SNase-like) [Trypanosoma melophagium]|uniref:Staphylococcal nuclease (SNase-like) n=1 Tax=Trypanosoma melophagium TaxID=715481 RepID=UPI00351A5C91|nr:Staphylococcal nuclease (SNase-like) [Trypanosoma melophagium]